MGAGCREEFADAQTVSVGRAALGGSSNASCFACGHRIASISVTRSLSLSRTRPVDWTEGNGRICQLWREPVRDDEGRFNIRTPDDAPRRSDSCRKCMVWSDLRNESKGVSALNYGRKAQDSAKSPFTQTPTRTPTRPTSSLAVFQTGRDLFDRMAGSDHRDDPAEILRGEMDTVNFDRGGRPIQGRV